MMMYWPNQGHSGDQPGAFFWAVFFTGRYELREGCTSKKSKKAGA